MIQDVLARHPLFVLLQVDGVRENDLWQIHLLSEGAQSHSSSSGHPDVTEMIYTTSSCVGNADMTTVYALASCQATTESWHESHGEWFNWVAYVGWTYFDNTFYTSRKRLELCGERWSYAIS